MDSIVRGRLREKVGVLGERRIRMFSSTMAGSNQSGKSGGDAFGCAGASGGASGGLAAAGAVGVGVGYKSKGAAGAGAGAGGGIADIDATGAAGGDVTDNSYIGEININT